MPASQPFTLRDMMNAAASSLAEEYLRATNAVSHGFPDEAHRRRYATLIHAWGMHVHPATFPAVLAERGSGSPAHTAPVKPVCSRCGSDSLVRDASARGDEDAQDWTISAVYDSTFCDHCSSESDHLCSWVPLDLPATLPAQN